jgi:hypothetical protein
VLNRGSATRQILNELVQLTKPSKSGKGRSMLAAAARRVEGSREDHAEAQAAQEKLTPERPTPVVEIKAIQPQRLRRAWPNLQPEK